MGLLTYPTMGEAVVAPLVFLVLTAVEGQFLDTGFHGAPPGAQPFCGVFSAKSLCTWLWVR